MTWYNIQIGSQTVLLVVKCQLNLKLKKYYKRVSYRPQSPTSNSNECLCVRLQIDQMSFKIEKLKKYYKRVCYIPQSPTSNGNERLCVRLRGETRVLIGGGGWIFIYSCSARRISFEINLNDSWFQKKVVGQNKKIWIFTPPINALISPLVRLQIDQMSITI